MPVAIVSDIHANLEAFAAVIRDIEQRTVEKVICLGDLIGYGPDPEDVLELFQTKGYISVLGNHEAALIDPKMRQWFNFQAKTNSIQTEQLLSPQSLAFCAGLGKSLVYENAFFVHGFPPDSVLAYLTMKTEQQLKAFFKEATRDLFFVGHTHDLLAISWDGDVIVKNVLPEKKYLLRDGYRYIINAGSVGQPRDGNNMAKYLLWDTRNRSIEACHVPYDFKITSRKIIERGFPEAYAYRLW